MRNRFREASGLGIALLGVVLAGCSSLAGTGVHETDASRAQAAASGHGLSSSVPPSGSGVPGVVTGPSAGTPAVVYPARSAGNAPGDATGAFVTRSVPVDRGANMGGGTPLTGPGAGVDPALVPVTLADSPIYQGRAAGPVAVPADMPFSSVAAYGSRELPSAPLAGGDENVFYELPAGTTTVTTTTTVTSDGAGTPSVVTSPAVDNPGVADPVRAALGGPVDYVQVRVAEGDTLFGLAFRFQTDARVIAAVNGLGPEQAIYPGQLLRVPVARLARAADGTVTLGAAGVAPGVVVPAPPADAGVGTPLPPPILGPDPPGGVVAVTPTAASPLKVVPGSFPPLATRVDPAEVRRQLGAPVLLLVANDSPVTVTPGPAREVAPVVAPDSLPAPDAIAVTPAPVLAAVPRTPHAPVKTAKPTVPPTVVAPLSTPAAGGTRAHWPWPTDGRVVQGFAPDNGAKGVDIAGRAGQPVRAVAPGKVVYSGNALKGYGELVIVKHSNVFLTAYAYNQKRLVKQGDDVTSGQPLAEMGTGPAGRPLLHFEVREKGLPVDPLDFLEARP